MHYMVNASYNRNTYNATLVYSPDEDQVVETSGSACCVSVSNDGDLVVFRFVARVVVVVASILVPMRLRAEVLDCLQFRLLT